MPILISESTATTKWCPFVRVGRAMANGTQLPSYNRREGMHLPEYDTRCIGSICMAWSAPHGGNGYCTLMQPKMDYTKLGEMMG